MIAATSDNLAPADPRRRRAAVMFADLVGYSARMEQNEERAEELIIRSVGLFKSLISDYGGQVANVAGDGILALFDLSDEALRFAIQMQTEFRDQAVWGEGDPVQFRIGLNFGEIMESKGIVQGHCVNVAARLQAMAEPGAIYITRAIRDNVRNKMGISLRSLGPQALKNISERIEVFSVDELPAATAPHAAPPHAPALPEPSRQPSVAVLPLANLSGDSAYDHLCQGVVEDIIANLSRFRNLMVIARHSSFLFSLMAYAAREIGWRLGVRYLLGGSLRRAGKRLRIAVELIDAEFESVIWSDHFDIDIGELFDLQDEITGAVASRLAVQIDFAQGQQESQYPRNMRAYGLVLRGQQLILRFSEEANSHARRLFEEAIEIAPAYGRAYSGASRTHNLD
jgi:TolB-like protein/class 3 adenylate cyclase